jgi:hypothetical protein
VRGIYVNSTPTTATTLLTATLPVGVTTLVSAKQTNSIAVSALTRGIFSLNAPVSTLTYTTKNVSTSASTLAYATQETNINVATTTRLRGLSVISVATNVLAVRTLNVGVTTITFPSLGRKLAVVNSFVALGEPKPVMQARVILAANGAGTVRGIIGGGQVRGTTTGIGAVRGVIGGGQVVTVLQADGKIEIGE